nr:O-antigen ligase family protein [uncultured Psychroserpens sp.]
MKLIKYIVLILLLWGFDSFVLFVYGGTIGSLASFATYAFLLLYYLIAQKRKFILPLIILGIIYFMISGLIYVESYKFYANDFVKYLIIIICGAEVARDTSHKELTYFLLLGASSILIHAIVFSGGYGRYSGLYLNPNGAAFVSLLGYCLAFQIKDIKTKYILLFAFTFAGVLTFSRFFFLMWLLTTLVSIYGDRKNIQVLGIGIGALVLLISVAAILQVNTTRFAFIEGLFQNDVKTQVLTKDDRLESWSKYYDDILNNPIFGNGYKSFSGADNTKQGVHNTYLMVLGESGVIPFFILIGIYIYLIKETLKTFRDYIYKFLLAVSLTAILLTMHNYFNNELILFLTIWLYTKLDSKNPDKELSTQ